MSPELALEQVYAEPIPSGILARVAEQHTALDERALRIGEGGLRQYFAAHLMCPDHVLPMPSRFVDEIWHAFILDTHAYTDYCEAVFGSYFHHVPDVAPEASGLVRLWEVCREMEQLPQFSGQPIPLLFRIDRVVDWPGGEHYYLDTDHTARLPTSGAVVLWPSLDRYRPDDQRRYWPLEVDGVPGGLRLGEMRDGSVAREHLPVSAWTIDPAAAGTAGATGGDDGDDAGGCGGGCGGCGGG